MQKIYGDIFEGKWDVLGHCVNLHHVWGAGIVVPIKKLYPEAFGADLDTKKSDNAKLGNFSFADCGDKRIYNLYAQVGIGNDGKPLNRNCQYDFLFDSLYCACEDIIDNPLASVVDRKTIFAVPMIGCGLAGGKPVIVEAIIQEVERYFSDHIEFHRYTI